MDLEVPLRPPCVAREDDGTAVCDDRHSGLILVFSRRPYDEPRRDDIPKLSFPM